MNGPGGHSQRGSHRLSTAPICPRMHYFRWNLGLKPREEPIYFTEGTVAHIALAYYRANQMHLRGMKVPDWFYERTMLDCLHEAGRGLPEHRRGKCIEHRFIVAADFRPFVQFAVSDGGGNGGQVTNRAQCAAGKIGETGANSQ